MTTATIQKGLSIIKKQILQYNCLILNSNPWYSAVSDYSLQLALFLKQNQFNVLYCADKQHTAMEKKCDKHNLDFAHVPLYNKPPRHFFVSFFKLFWLLLKQKKIEFVFIFEGREQTLCGLSKLFFPFLWKHKKLIRIRGQAQKIRKQPFSFLLYRYLTDQIVYTSQIIAQEMPYQLPPNKTKICFYGKTEHFPEQTINYYHFIKQNYGVHFNSGIMTFFMLGRFDPIKGHDLLLESFIKADFKDTRVQLICVGAKANTSASELYEKYKDVQIFTNQFKLESIYHLSTTDDKKKIIMIEDHFNDVFLFMKHSTFGVISSLGSEMICRVGVEFLQASVPVLYSDAGALPEVFSDFPDFKFKCHDVHELTQKFELAHTIYQDHERYLLLKEKAYTVWETLYQGDVYKSILA